MLEIIERQDKKIDYLTSQVTGMNEKLELLLSSITSNTASVNGLTRKVDAIAHIEVIRFQMNFKPNLFDYLR